MIQRLRPRHIIASTIVSSSLINMTSAALVLSDLQPISGFAAQCQAAYTSPIAACPSAASFMDGGSTSGCDKACFVALNQASLLIQQACTSAAAYGDTVISHAFQGDLSVYLCGNEFGSGSNTVTATNVGTTSLSSAPTSSSGISMTQTGKSTTSFSSTGQSSTISSSSSATQTTSSSLSNTSSTKSASQTTITTMTKSSSPSKTNSVPTTSSTPFDSSPFDQGVPNSAETILSSTSVAGLLAITSSCTVLGLTWLFS